MKEVCIDQNMLIISNVINVLIVLTIITLLVVLLKNVKKNRDEYKRKNKDSDFDV